MSGPFGVTASGFVAKQQSDIIADLNAALQNAFGADINLNPASDLGMLVGVLSERIAAAWQGLQDVYDQFNPDAVGGTGLDAISAVTGTIRQTPTYSVAKGVVLFGTNGTIITALSVGQTQTLANKFNTPNASKTLVTANNYVNNNLQVVGDVIKNSGNMYWCAQGGHTSAIGSGPTAQAQDIVDNEVIWDYIVGSAGSVAFVEVDMTAQVTGNIPALSGTLNSISTPIAGWAGLWNPLDAQPGIGAEQDPPLRVRRVLELHGNANAATDAVQTHLLENIPGVISVGVFNNDTDFTDVNGLPPHSIECVVEGGVPAVIAQAIWDSKGGGIATYGTSSAVAVDKNGNPHTMNYTVPTAVNVWVTVNLKAQATEYPQAPATPGDDLVKQALLSYAAANYQRGSTVVWSKLFGVVEGVQGVFDVTSIFIGLASSPSGVVNLSMSLAQIASLDSSRIVVNSTVGNFN